MEWNDLKEDLLIQLKDWAEQAPTETVRGKISGKSYTRPKWVQAIEDNNEDAKAFLEEIFNETAAELESKTNNI